MQSSGFLTLYLIVFIALVILLVFYIIIRQLAVKQYRLKRKYEAEDSFLFSLGDMVSNTRKSLFDFMFLIIYILAISQGLSYLGLLVDHRNLLLALIICALVLIMGIGVFLFYTVRGRAYRRTERILDDHQTLGHEDWIIRKHLAELMHESEGNNLTSAEIARVTLENLMGKQNRTGDAVRNIMENPEQLRDIERMKAPPSLFMFLRGSLLIHVVLLIILVYVAYGVISGSLSQIDLFTNAIPLALLMIFAQILCFCVETPRAREASRKARFGI